jgi:hypothetical protein
LIGFRILSRVDGRIQILNVSSVRIESELWESYRFGSLIVNMAWGKQILLVILDKA